MCLSTSSADSTGILYDSGGPNDNYQNNENCTLLIAPPCATSITLSFQHFDTESGFDSFHVYDGNTTSDPELLVVDGNIVPGPVTGTSGSMLIVWISDHNVSDTGFACSWNSVISPSLAPAAAFSIGNNNPPMGTDVYFTDETVGPATGWLWYFGDGDTSQSQNPIHIYSSPGTYTVTLISFHCSESDTVLHSIDVQAAPQINVAPASGFTANLTCGDSETFFLNVGNTAGGQLV